MPIDVTNTFKNCSALPPWFFLTQEEKERRDQENPNWRLEEAEKVKKESEDGEKERRDRFVKAREIALAKAANLIPDSVPDVARRDLCESIISAYDDAMYEQGYED